MHRHIIAAAVSLVQFLSVHVRMRAHGAAFQRSIHTQRQVPRVHFVFGVHDFKTLMVKCQTTKNVAAGLLQELENPQNEPTGYHRFRFTSRPR